MTTRKPKLKYFLGAAILAGLIFFIARSPSPYPAALQDTSPARTSLNPETESALPSYPTVEIGGIIIPVEIARDSAAVQKGLSGRTFLEADRGMLFIFPAPGRYRFWMPDMHFPLDIIWIAGGKIIAIDENVPPENKMAEPRFYTPPKPVTHVLEVNAGFARTRGVDAGDPVTLHHVE